MTPASAADLLRSIDPARPASGLSVTEADTRDCLLLQLQTSPAALSPAGISATGVSPAFLRRPRLTRRTVFVTLGAVAATACAAALVFAALPNTDASSTSYALPAHGSLASWTATPQHADATPADVQACASRLGFGADPDHPVTTLTSERRGDFVSLFIEQGSADGYCVLADGSVQNSIDFTGLAKHPLTDSNAASTSTVQGSQWMTVVSGHAGANVTHLSVQNPFTGEQVTAALAKGVWSAWWPVDSSEPQATATAVTSISPVDVGREAPLTITYELADGTTRTGDGDSDEADPVGEGPLPALGSLPGWSATATPFTPSASQVAACAAVAAGWPEGSAQVVLAERRAEFETVVLERGGDRAYCIGRDGSIVASQDTGTPPIIELPANGAASPVTLVQMQDSNDTTPGQRLVTATGTAAPGVTEVVLHLAGGNDVRTTVQNGAWMAWWPGAALVKASDGTPVPDGMPTISWVTADGVQHDPSE